MEEHKYEVKWKEYHFTEVKAENETKAFEEAAHYAQEHDTCVDEDEYECRTVFNPPDSVWIDHERTAAVIRDALNMRRVITISVDDGTAIIEDRLIHPIENHSRMHKTVMEAEMLDELIRRLGYVRREEVYNDALLASVRGMDTRVV